MLLSFSRPSLARSRAIKILHNGARLQRYDNHKYLAQELPSGWEALQWRPGYGNRPEKTVCTLEALRNRRAIFYLRYFVHSHARANAALA
jgi:hypothetical protein